MEIVTQLEATVRGKLKMPDSGHTLARSRRKKYNWG